MPVRDQSLVVSALPRALFLAHSESLVQHLLSLTKLPASPEILELGCGPRSPLVPMLQRALSSEYQLHQIDARPDSVEKAKAWNPQGKVDRMFINDMSSIPTGSKDLVIAMSVFDQNHASSMQPMATEVRRVLKDDGFVVYVHNEELNAPATAASMLSGVPPEYLLPSPEWTPTSDREYCLATKEDMDHAIGKASDSISNLQGFLRAMTPPSTLSPSTKVQVPAIGKMTPPIMQQIRKELSQLTATQDVPLRSVGTAELMAQHVEGRLFSKTNQFEVCASGVFEIQQATRWSQWFKEKPQVRHFVRGVSKFGYASHERNELREEFHQVLNEEPELASDDEVLLTAYQYGLCARKANV